MRIRLLTLSLLLLGAFAISVASASADRINVDFESGPPLRTAVQDDYLASAFVSFPQDPGYRPYRTDVGQKAHSGHVVADVSGSLCQLETTGSGSDCEFVTGGTTGRLARTATSVTVFAGAINDQPQPETVMLIGHPTNGTDVVSANVPISSAITTPVSVSSPAGDIDSFTLEASAGDLAFDDLTLDFPQNSLPDISPTTTSQVVPALSGNRTPVQISLGRVNGSNGPVRVSVTGLPSGVTAQPVTSSATATSATLVLTAAANAPSTNFQPTRATVTADPLGSAKVAPSRRLTNLDVRVASPYDLAIAQGHTGDVALPACAPVDVPIVLPRDISFSGMIHVGVDGLPPDVSADVQPSADVLPGVGLTAERTIRFTRTTASKLPADVTVKAQSGTTVRTVKLHLDAALQTAMVTTGLGLTPRLRTDGTEIRITGNGFCPGTSVKVGNINAVVDATVLDAHTLSFHVPTLATTDRVGIDPSQGDPGYMTSNTLQIDSFRNVDGFQFHNFPFDGLSLGELTDAFGADDLFLKVNPCGLWGGDCTVVTGILDPTVALQWPIISEALKNSNGHCFGISRAVQEFLSRKKSLRSFTTGGSVFSIPSADHPQTFVAHCLDSQHALQASGEFLRAWLLRDRSVRGQVDRVRSALAPGDFPIVAIRHGFDGHALIAYNLVDDPDGTAEIYTYDPNREFSPLEDTGPGSHALAVLGSNIHVDAARGSWSYDRLNGDTWSGGNGGTLFAVPESTIPQDPALPGSSLFSEGNSLGILMFGSDDDAVRLTGSPSGADYVPPLDSNGNGGAGGTLVLEGSARPVSASLVGRKDGQYSAAVISNRFAGSVTGVTTTPGVHDELRGRGDTVTFDGGENRPLTVQLAQRPTGADATAWSATLHTDATSRHADSAGLSPAGRLSYRHDGAATTVSFMLAGLSPRAGSNRFASGPVPLGAGDRLSVNPDGRLGSVHVTIADGHGQSRSMTLRNRARAQARLTLGRPRLAGSLVRVQARVAGLKSRAVMGVVLRIVRGRRLLLRRVTSVRHTQDGRRTFRFALPHLASGHYRLLANASLITIANPTRG